MTIKNGCTKKVLWLLESSIIVFALFAKAEVIPYDGSESALVAFIARLRDSFEGSDITGLILFAVFYYLQREAALRKLKNDWRIILLSGLFAVMYIAARSMDDSGTLAFMNAGAYQCFFSFLCILGYWLMFDLVLRWVFCSFENAELGLYSGKPEVRVWLCYSAVILICYLPYIFSNYPATFCPDSRWQLRQGLGYAEYTLHHPPLSTAIMTLCVNLGAAVKSRNFGCFIYILMQTALGSMIFSYALVILRRMGISRGARIAALLFYCLNPLWGKYCQWFEKDLLYYVAYAGDDVTEYEREVIGSVLDYDTLAESYSYACSDPVKNKYHGDSEALKKYFPVWFRMGLKHPTIYIDALVGISCGYIAPIENGFTEPGTLILTDGVTETDIPGISTRTYEALSIPTTLIWRTAHIIPVLKLFTMPGIYTWLTLACIVMLWIKKKASAMLPLIPGVMNILVCIASPLASSIRYCLPAVAMMPVILWWTAMNVSSVSKNNGDACNG